MIGAYRVEFHADVERYLATLAVWLAHPKMTGIKTLGEKKTPQAREPVGFLLLSPYH